MSVPVANATVNSTRRAQTLVTCLVTAGVIVAAGIVLFRSPTPVVADPRVIGEDLSTHGGYAPWRVAIMVVLLLALAVWTGLRRTPLTAAWAAAAGAAVVPLVIAALNPSSAGTAVTATIGIFFAGAAAGTSFLTVAILGSMVDAMRARRERRRR